MLLGSVGRVHLSVVYKSPTKDHILHKSKNSQGKSRDCLDCFRRCYYSWAVRFVVIKALCMPTVVVAGVGCSSASSLVHFSEVSVAGASLVFLVHFGLVVLHYSELGPILRLSFVPGHYSTNTPFREVLFLNFLVTNTNWSTMNHYRKRTGDNVRCF